MKNSLLTILGSLLVVTGIACTPSTGIFLSLLTSDKPVPAMSGLFPDTEPGYRIIGNTIYIQSSIGDLSQYTGLVEELDHCQGERLVELTTYGGDANTMYVLSDAIRNSKCEITVHVRGVAASAGAIIAMSADHVVLAPGAVLMFHDGQVQTAGPRSQVIKRLSFMGHQYEEYLRSNIQGLLSEEEIQGILNGEEVWLTKSDFDKRYKDHASPKASQPSRTN